MRILHLAGALAALALAAVALWSYRPPLETSMTSTEITMPMPADVPVASPADSPASPAPPAEALAPLAEVPAPPTEASAPAAEASAPPAEASAPPAEASAPPAEASAPPAEASAPTAEVPAPPTEAQSVPTLPKLPSREVAMRTPHAVPENDPIPPARPFEFKSAPGLAAQPTPRGASARAARLAGAAQASGATALLVAGRPLVLFGVRPPGGADRCLSPGSLNLGAPPTCVDKAHAALAARLARNPTVSCRLPAPATAAGAAICLDAEGVDLGGLLVAEGLALADPSQSYDYVGAETVARSQGRGLWHFR